MRGLNSPLKRHELKKQIQNLKICCGAVLETRVRHDNMPGILSLWDSSIWKTSHNCHLEKNCRIIVFWKVAMVFVDVLLVTDQLIHCKLVTADGVYTCCVSFLYTHNSVEKRKGLWRDLVSLHSSMDVPWLISGDFNVVMSTIEKVTPFRQPNIVSTELSDLCSATDLHDIKFVGQVFTWDNSHTYCKLDRVLGNGLWENTFPGTIVDFLPKSISDHAIAVVKVFKPKVLHAANFHFKNFWVEDPDFYTVVERCLNKPVQGCAMFRLVSFLKHLKMDLKKRNGDKYMNLDGQVLAAKQELDQAHLAVQSQPACLVAKADAKKALDHYVSLCQQ